MKNLTVSASGYPQNKEVTVISVKGFIDMTTAPEFERTFQSVLGENKFNLVVDLKEVTYISSVGWGIFIGEIKRIRAQKGNLVLACMSPEVADAYELLQFNSIIKSFPTVEQAVQGAFGKVKGGKAPAMAAVAAPSNGKAGSAVVNPSSSQPVGAVSQIGQTALTAPKTRSFTDIFKPWKWF